MVDRILTVTKKALGLAEDYAPFDPEILMHINSVLADLNQLGIGPEKGFAIVNAEDTWDEVIGEELRYNGVQSYMYLRVKMLFDPPSVGYVLTAMEKLIEKAEFRLNTAREDIVYPMPVVEPDPVVVEGSPI